LAVPQRVINSADFKYQLRFGVECLNSLEKREIKDIFLDMGHSPRAVCIATFSGATFDKLGA